MARPPRPVTVRRHLPAAVVATLLAACGDLPPTAPAGAPALARAGSGTTLQVTTRADRDDGACTVQDCTLREALRLAPSGATITFKNLSGTIALDPTAASPTLVVDRSLTIQGPGAGLLTVAMSQQAGRVFRIAAGDVTISGLTITGGTVRGEYVAGEYVAREGGGIYVEAANLTLRDVALVGNVADFGGALALADGSNAVLERCTLSGNTAEYGGAVKTGRYGTNQVVLRQSTVRDNRADVDGGGIWHASGSLRLEQSTLSGNLAGRNGGAVVMREGDVTIDRSTLSGNRAASGGALYNYVYATLTLVSSTVTGNFAAQAGGLFSVSGVDRLTNTILAGNTASATPGTDDCRVASTSWDATSSGGYNVTSPGTGCAYIPTMPGDRLVPASQLFQTVLFYYLDDNGGPTRTHRLLDPAATGQPNPALDGGTCAETADQRGLTRPVDLASTANAAGGNGCDIGAFEMQAPAKGGPRR